VKPAFFFLGKDLSSARNGGKHVDVDVEERLAFPDFHLYFMTYGYAIEEYFCDIEHDIAFPQYGI
jgi:hypothetical protein